MCYVGKELWIDIFLKTTKKSKRDFKINYVKITVDGKATELSTKRKCELSRWNTAAGRESGNKESTKELNYYLDTLEQMIYQAKRSLNDSDKQVTAQAIKDVLNGVTEKPRMMYFNTTTIR
jgi:flagellar biosynthesis chaperone FliJ